MPTSRRTPQDRQPPRRTTTRKTLEPVEDGYDEDTPRPSRDTLVVSAKRSTRKAIKVHLVGEDYTIVPPKSSTMLKMALGAGDQADPKAQWALLENWVLKAFGEDEGNLVLDRLEDEDDDLDVDHLEELIEAVMERATRNPTS